MTFFDYFGLVGAIIVTYSNVPQMVLFVRQGHARGISLSSTWLGTLGVSIRTIYLIHTTGWNLIVLGPYFFAIACCLLTLYYCYRPRKL